MRFLRILLIYVFVRVCYRNTYACVSMDICASIEIYQTRLSFRFNIQIPKKEDSAMPSSDAWKWKQKDFPQKPETTAMREGLRGGSGNLSKDLLLTGKEMVKHFTNRRSEVLCSGTAEYLPFFHVKWKRLAWLSCPIPPLNVECETRGC